MFHPSLQSKNEIKLRNRLLNIGIPVWRKFEIAEWSYFLARTLRSLYSWFWMNYSRSYLNAHRRLWNYEKWESPYRHKNEIPIQWNELPVSFCIFERSYTEKNEEMRAKWLYLHRIRTLISSIHQGSLIAKSLSLPMEFSTSKMTYLQDSRRCHLSVLYVSQKSKSNRTWFFLFWE